MHLFRIKQAFTPVRAFFYASAELRPPEPAKAREN
jgi:hypothetical protein